MKTYRLLFVEDQRNYAISLQNHLKPFLHMICFYTTLANTVEKATTIILDTTIPPFDVTILDYQLRSQTCFDLLEITKNHSDRYGIVTLTTINNTMQQAFIGIRGFDPDYLILKKPFNSINIAQFIDEFTAKVFKQNQQIAYLPDFSSTQKYNQIDISIALNLGTIGEKYIRSINDILYIEGNGHNCNYYIIENEVITIINNVQGTLGKQIEQYKLSNIFLRVHLNYIVNISRVRLAKKDGRTSGWLSFLNKEYSEIENKHCARYSTQSENFEKLKQIMKFKKLD